jgi:Outer membrane cobalamin receptor protein
MRKTSFFKVACVAAFWCCALAWAGGAAVPPSEDSPEDVSIVSANDPVQDLGSSDVVSATGYLPAQDVSYTEINSSAWEGKSLTAADLLSTLPGIQAYKQGGLGSFQSVSIRGIAARNILICVDGVPLNDASGGAVNLSSIDLNQMEKVEVFKGNVPAKFGVTGLGGAVNFVTKNAVKRGGRVLLAYGSHNTWEGAFQVSSPVTDSIMFASSFATRHSDNDYEYTNRNGTQYNDDDDYTATRQNAEYTDVSGNAQFRMLHGNGSFSTLAVTATRFEGGNPGKEEQQTVVADFVGESALIRYGLESPGFFDEALFLYGGLSYRFDKNVSSFLLSVWTIWAIRVTSSWNMGALSTSFVPEVSAEWTLWNRLKGAARVAAEWERAEARGVSKDWALDRLNLVSSGDLYYQFFKYAGLGGEGSVHFLKDHLDEGTFVLPTGGRTLDEAEDRDLTFSGRAYTRLGNSEIPGDGGGFAGPFLPAARIDGTLRNLPGSLIESETQTGKGNQVRSLGPVQGAGKAYVLESRVF